METIFERMGSLATLLDDELQTIETRFRVLSTSSQSHFDGPAKKVVECQREIESLKKDIDGLIHVADEQYKHFDGFLKRIIDRLSTIPEMPSHATSVEEFHKVLEQFTRSSSPSKSPLENVSPMLDQRQVPKIDILEEDSLASSSMLKANEQNYGVHSTYKSNLEEYTSFRGRKLLSTEVDECYVCNFKILCMLTFDTYVCICISDFRWYYPSIEWICQK